MQGSLQRAFRLALAAGLLAPVHKVSGSGLQGQSLQGEAPASAGPAFGHPLPSPSLQVRGRQGTIVLDGKLTEPDWGAVTPGIGFRQAAPDDGAAATQPTEIRLLFDGEGIYFGARMFDSLGAAGVRTRLVRRDQETDSDWIEVLFDTFHDHIGRTSFAVNPSGVRRDAGVATSNLNSSWDPVWEVATAIDSLGWTVEARIPLSQLRFAPGRAQVWGMQVSRTVSRLNEVSMWSYWSQTETGGPSRFGHVTGIEITGKPRRLEVVPYVLGSSRFNTPAQAGDPFHDGSEMTSRVGADLKYLLTSNLTLSATINPDFGQVEVDPAVVNLSAFETFFPEKRPFFIEGSGTFGFGGFSCFFCSNVSSLSLVHTRRMGRTPQGGLPGAEFSDRPDATSILGAAKLTGRTPSGYTIGVLDALTARESGRFIAEGVPGRQEVEPLTNYFIGRVKKDSHGGDLQLGGILTSVARDFGSDALRSSIPSHAEAAGFDWRAAWKNRTYSFVGNLAASNVSGEPDAVLRLQQSSARYFQRPDRQAGGNGLFSDRLDPDATGLRGFGGYARLAKESGHWRWESAVNFRSPGFESNDLGFNTRSDLFWMNANLVRSYPTPGSWYRWLWISLGGQQEYNFDGDLTDRQFQANFSGQFRNYWRFGTFIIRRPAALNDRATRGGPAVGRPGSSFWFLNGGTDSRKVLALDADLSFSAVADGGYSRSASVDLTLKPTSNLSLSLGPSWNRSRTTSQYVQTVDDPTRTEFFGRRYVFADTRQTSVSMNTRLNVTFRPNLTLELFAQPFISSVDFDRFKEFARPRVVDKLVYGVDAGTITAQTDDQGRTTAFEVDPDAAGPSAPFTIGNPDFVFRSLRGNAVLRWEYLPGSTLFLVWTQTRSQTDLFTGDFAFRSADGSVFGRQPDNIFLLKASFWLNY